MTIKKFAAIACGVSLFFSCSSLQQTGFLGMGKRVVATEQNISVSPVRKTAPQSTPGNAQQTIPAMQKEMRTLLIKSDTSEKSVVLVAGIALKDSSILSAYTVIVGSYTLPEKSIQLINKLKLKALDPFFVRNEKGMYRLVAGTFDNKDDADFLMLKLDVDDIDAWILERLVNPK